MSTHVTCLQLEFVFAFKKRKSPKKLIGNQYKSSLPKTEYINNVLIYVINKLYLSALNQTCLM